MVLIFPSAHTPSQRAACGLGVGKGALILLPSCETDQMQIIDIAWSKNFI